MNDEELARQAFANAFASEPATLPDLDRIAARGRRARRARTGMYAASGVALAGVVTAGALAAPGLITKSGTSYTIPGSTSHDAATSGVAEGWSDFSGPACTTSDAAKATSVVDAIRGKLEGWNIDGKPGVLTCASLAGGALGMRTTIAVGADSAVDVTVRTDQPEPTGAGWFPAEELEAQARDRAEHERQARQAAESAASARANADGETGDGAVADGTASSPATSSDKKTIQITSMPCEPGAGGASLCYSELSSGGWAQDSVLLLRGGAHPLTIALDSAEGTLAGTNPAPMPPLTRAQLTEITSAIAALF